MTGDKQQRSTQFEMCNKVGNKHNTLTLHPLRNLHFQQFSLICRNALLILLIRTSGHLRRHHCATRANRSGPSLRHIYS
jgi:hypothetical protein